MSGSKSTPERGTRSQPTPVVRDALRALARSLQPAHGTHAARQAELLLMEVLGVSREQLYLQADSLTAAQQRTVQSMAHRLAGGEPLAYVLGTAYFHCVKLAVDRSVLIPRPDTETLVETVLAQEPSSRRVFADMGTGSGAIAAALLDSRPEWRCVATDVELKAVAVARRNTPSHACMCVQMDRLEALKGPVDFVVSNPPYIPAADIAALDASVREYEPEVALDGGRDGLEFYRWLAARAGGVLAAQGRLYLEIGFDQGQEVSGLLLDSGWQDVSVRRDLASRPRVVAAGRPRG